MLPSNNVGNASSTSAICGSHFHLEKLLIEAHLLSHFPFHLKILATSSNPIECLRPHNCELSWHKRKREGQTIESFITLVWGIQFLSLIFSFPSNKHFLKPSLSSKVSLTTPTGILLFKEWGFYMKWFTSSLGKYIRFHFQNQVEILNRSIKNNRDFSKTYLPLYSEYNHHF